MKTIPFGAAHTYMAYIWDIYILDWGTEKAWDEYNRLTQGVGVRRIGERGRGEEKCVFLTQMKHKCDFR